MYEEHTVIKNSGHINIPLAHVATGSDFFFFLFFGM